MITSRQNQRLKDIRRLRRSKGNRALLEGPHLVADAIAAGHPLETVLATPDWLQSPEGMSLARGLTPPPLQIEPRLLREITDADSPQGVLAIAHLPRSGVESLPVREGGVYLFLDGLQDPANLGALARVAEAAGAAGLALAPGTVHPNHPRVLRGSAGSLLRMPAAVAVDPDQLEDHLAPVRPHWIALVPRVGEDLWASPLDGTLILALGAEGRGLSTPLQERAALCLSISVEPPVESLNATVAAALVLFEIRRRKHLSMF